MSQLFAVFVAVFLAELGDKTQLATMMFAAKGDHPAWLIFVAASAALVASTALAVLFGGLAERWLAALPLKLIAGAGFILLGAWMVWEHLAAGRAA